MRFPHFGFTILTFLHSFIFPDSSSLSFPVLFPFLICHRRLFGAINLTGEQSNRLGTVLRQAVFPAGSGV